jgi:hypothetical protein
VANSEPSEENEEDPALDDSGGGGDDDVYEALGGKGPISSIKSGWGPSEEPAEVIPSLDPPFSSRKFSSGIKGGEGIPIPVAGPGSER